MILPKELETMAASFDDAKFETAISKLVASSWEDWFKKLLTHLCRAYFPTVKAKQAVQTLESFFHGEFNPIKEELSPEHARLIGHLCALFDFYIEKTKPILSDDEKMIERWTATRAQFQTNPVIELLTRHSNFEERAAFLENFSFAYSRTFTPAGELRGSTDATRIYLKLLVWMLLGAATRQPESVAELHRWMVLQENRPKLSNLEELRRRDADALELRRLQQICERGLGLKFSKKSESAKTTDNK